MASLFRRRIATRIVQVLSEHRSNTDTERLASLIRINSANSKKPQFTFSWKRGLELQLISEPQITPDILHVLRGKGFILADGVISVEDSQDKHGNLFFTVDRDYFIKEVLLEAYKNVESLRKISPVFSFVPTSKVVLEYSSPNIAKPLHAGHIRSTIIGQVVGNIHKYMDNEVHRINYLGDWGTQYGILSAGYDVFSSKEEMENNPLEHLFQVYVASNAESEANGEFLKKAKDIFRQMEAGDEKHLKRWRYFKEISMKELNKVYARLDVEFDDVQSESDYHKSAADLVQNLVDKNLATLDSDGAIRISIPWPNQEDRAIPLVKTDSSTLYISRDLGAVIARKQNYNFDTSIYVVERSQTDHFIALKAILKKMGHEWADNIMHLRFGRISGMSTRKGKVVFLNDLLDEAKLLALKTMEISRNTNPDGDPEETAEILGISAVIINDLRLKRNNDYVFDWGRALHHKGDSGMELQYCHARLCSLDKTFHKLLNESFDSKALCEPEALQLAIHIASFDEAILRTYLELEPYILVMYLFQLNFYISKAYKQLSLSRNERRVAESRYFLFHTARLVLQQGMKLLGLKPLRQM